MQNVEQELLTDWENENQGKRQPSKIFTRRRLKELPEPLGVWEGENVNE